MNTDATFEGMDDATTRRETPKRRFWRCEFASLAFCLILLLVSSIVRGEVSTAKADKVTKPGLGALASLPSEAQSAISASVGRNEDGYHARTGVNGLRVQNAQQQLSADFSTRGTELIRGGGHWMVKLQRYGHGTDLVTVAAAAPIANSNRVEYHRGAMTEWYVNGPLGLEQGFTLSTRPASGDDLPLRIVLTLSGNLTARTDDDKLGMALADHFGQPVMRYTGLNAHDAIGKALPAWLEVHGQQLLIQVSDLGAVYPVVVDPFIEASKLIDSKGGTGDRFGYSVANNWEDDTVIVGSPGASAAYIFERPRDGWGSLTTETSKLTVKGQVGVGFGVAVSIYSNTVVVGARFAEGNGRAYVFVRRGESWRSEAEVKTYNARLLPGNPKSKKADEFGSSVSISGRRVVVGAPNTPDTGAAYVFSQPDDGWKGDINANAVLKPRDREGKGLGFSVAQYERKSVSIVVAGQRSSVAFCTVGPVTRNCGRVLVFVAPEGRWKGPTNETATLTPEDGNCLDGCRFGRAVSAVSGTIAVGAPFASVGTGKDRKPEVGAAYIFLEPAGGWGKQHYPSNAKLSASDGQTGDSFGWSVNLGQDFTSLLVGAPLYLKAGSGKAYLFKKSEKTGWKSIKESQVFTAGGTNDYFGSSVSTSNAHEDTLTIGALRSRGGKDDVQPEAGAAFVFVPSKGQNPGVEMGVSTSPDTGVPEVNSLTISASAFPDGDINPANVVVKLAVDCHGDALVTTHANSVVSGGGNTKLLSFLLPSGIAPGQYFVSISDSEEGDANFESSNCSAVNVAE